MSSQITSVAQYFKIQYVDQVCTSTQIRGKLRLNEEMGSGAATTHKTKCSKIAFVYSDIWLYRDICNVIIRACVPLTRRHYKFEDFINNVYPKQSVPYKLIL